MLEAEEKILNFVLQENEQLKSIIKNMSIESKLKEFGFSQKATGSEYYLRISSDKWLIVNNDCISLDYSSVDKPVLRIQLGKIESFEDLELFLRAFKVVVYKLTRINYDDRE